MKRSFSLAALAAVLLSQSAQAIMERGDYPWKSKLRSWYDKEMKGCLKGFDEVPWLLNLGPTGIRARIYADKPTQLVVKYVFQDEKSPARGKIKAEDVIVGANGRKFTTSHIFGRTGRARNAGWGGPMMELAHHIEDSQGEDGKLYLNVWAGGNSRKQKVVEIQLRPVGRFSPTFPYDCPRSERLLEELCDFIVMDYKSGNWKSANSFYGGPHGVAHQVLALMASGIPKYDPIIKQTVSQLAGKRFSAAGGGFQTWQWGFNSIVLGEYYLLTKDKSVIPAMENLAEVMPLGSRQGNGIYTHRSELNLRLTSRKPYASIADISGLMMIGMSLFKTIGVQYSYDLYDNIHGHYLNSATPESENIAYAFGGPEKFNPHAIGPRHAIIELENPKEGLSGRGPGFLCPTGMKDITKYKVTWPHPGDFRWDKVKPLDWIEDERATNTVTELAHDIKGKGKVLRRIDRNHPKFKKWAPEPTRPYNTTRGGGHLGPVGMGALSHLIGNKDNKTWGYMAMHCANTCALSPGAIFDGHAASNIHAFWSILGAARSDRPQQLRKFLDYVKTYVILSETHNGGMILQPLGRDRPGCNSDTAFGPRVLTTASMAILLSLPKKRLQITGAGTTGGAGVPSAARRTRPKKTVAKGEPRKFTPPKKVVREADAATIARHDDMLVERITAALEAGGEPRFLLGSLNCEVRITAVEGEGILGVETIDPPMKFSVMWDKMTIKAKKGVALGLLKEGDEAGHALVAFYALASGDKEMAKTHLEKAGQAAAAVRAVFE